MQLKTTRFCRLLLSAILLLVSCTRGEPEPKKAGPSPFQVRVAKRSDPDDVDRSRQISLPRVQFIDVHSEAGIEHIYQNGAKGESLMVEATGGGCGWLDFDADGLWDFYVSQGGDPTVAATQDQPLDRLFQNLGAGKFREVTDVCFIRETKYSQGVSVGDFDDDGFDDLYVTNVGANALLRNCGDGTFEDVTISAGVEEKERWSSSSAWADLDQDGDLDLYVCNYLRYDPLHPIICRNTEGEPRTCHPRDIPHWPDECYFNQGDGTFYPQAAARGLFGEGNKALGVIIADFNDDFLPDIFVANDTQPNFLFRNLGQARFEEVAKILGCAVDRNGLTQANMGLACGDYDHNGLLDVYVTTFYEESNTLFRNLGATGFQDITGIVGLHKPTLLRLGFGAVMVDFNQDGQQELLITNGHIENFANNPIYEQSPQLFTFDGNAWKDISESSGKFFTGKFVGRGLATCDFDEDGDVDIAIVHQNSPTAILRNESERGHWIALQFTGTNSNRRGVGVHVTVESGANRQVNQLCGGTSYASAHQPRLHFGLGSDNTACTVTVRWPSGVFTVLKDVLPDKLYHVRESD